MLLEKIQKNSKKISGPCHDLLILFYFCCFYFCFTCLMSVMNSHSIPLYLLPLLSTRYRRPLCGSLGKLLSSVKKENTIRPIGFMGPCFSVSRRLEGSSAKQNYAFCFLFLKEIERTWMRNCHIM